MNDLHRFFLNTAFLLATAYTCAQSNTTHYIMQDTVQRSFIVHLPTGYNAANPVSCVFNLHGASMTAAYQQLYTKMDAVANANQFMVVYPNGIDNAWMVGTGGIYEENGRDVDFIAAILDTLETLYSINPARVYACGLSQGGFMSHRLACDLQDRFAAVASVAGAMADSAMFYCDNQRNVPALFINGVADPYVPYAWAEEAATFWTNHNGCDLSPVITDLPDNNTTDGSTVQHLVYNNCGNDAAVEMFRITGGGHTWPSPFMNLSGYGNTNYDISASQEIWKFFNRFSIHGSVAGTKEQEIPSLKIYPNPATNTIHLSGITGSFHVKIVDAQGVAVLEVHDMQLVNISGLASGFYYVLVSNQAGTFIEKVVKE